MLRYHFTPKCTELYLAISPHCTRLDQPHSFICFYLFRWVSSLLFCLLVFCVIFRQEIKIRKTEKKRKRKSFCFGKFCLMLGDEISLLMISSSYHLFYNLQQLKCFQGSWLPRICSCPRPLQLDYE